MMNRSIILAVFVLFGLAACSDKTASDAAKAKEHFLTEQQKILEQAREVQDAATEAMEKQKKMLEEMQNK